MKRALSYLRVSGKKQIGGSGFDRQKDTINKFCKSNGWEIVKVYKEQISGTKSESERPVFMSMITDILSNGVSMIIVESLDRLARAYSIQEQLLIYLSSKKIDLISANTGENITQAVQGDPTKKCMIQIQGSIAELEKNLIVQRLRKGRDKKRKESGRCGGVPRYGSTHEEKQVLLKISYLRRLSKGQSKRRSYQVIADILNAENILTRTGKKWNSGLVFHVHSQGGK